MPLALIGTIIAEEEGVAEFADVGLAGEQRIRVFGFTESGHVDGFAADIQSGTEHVIEAAFRLHTHGSRYGALPAQPEAVPVGC